MARRRKQDDSAQSKAEQSEAKSRTERAAADADDGAGFESETPSAKAVAKVGVIAGEDVDHADDAAVEEARKAGEAYAAEKSKHRWG